MYVTLTVNICQVHVPLVCHASCDYAHIDPIAGIRVCTQVVIVDPYFDHAVLPRSEIICPAVSY